MSVNWNKNGNWLLTASRDHLIKVYDIRAMKEMYTLKGHKKDVNSKELAGDNAEGRIVWAQQILHF